MRDIATEFRHLLVDQLGVDESEVTAEASIADDLGADSLDTIEVIMACEETFGVEIPDADAERIRTVGDAVAYIERRLPATAKS